ncbi:MAG: heme biosynthesis HemY N-terminal domain-containing protein [Pseudomonadota bacterium]
MILIALFILMLFALAAAFVWLADHPGTVTIEWPWLGSSIEISLLQAVIAVAFLAVLATVFWLIVAAILNSPKAFGRWQKGRRRDKGFDALSKGLIAAGAGNAPLARKLAKDSHKYLDDEPLLAMLDAQSALLEGKRKEAREQFETMLEKDETKLLGLRGLYVEAEQEGVTEAAAYFAGQATEHAPGTPWAAKALLKAQTATGQWEEALRSLGMNNASGLLERGEYERKRAVLLTALAQSEEDGDPEKARTHALAAHKLAPDLVPAALVAARAAQRNNDDRKAGKVLEASWKRDPHPEVGQAYVNLKEGHSAAEKRKRAETLARKHPEHVESLYLLAQTNLDAGEFVDARKAMEKLLTAQPSERACLLMADIEEAEHGDKGRVREWLARAVSAPRDATWVADGVVADKWAPVSPVDGRLDAFEWRVPEDQQAQLAGSVDYAQLVHAPLPAETPKTDPVIETKDEKPTVTPMTETPSASEEINSDKVVDAEVVEPKTKETTKPAPAAKADAGSSQDSAAKTKPVESQKTEQTSGEGAIERTIEAVKVGGSPGAVAAGIAGVAVGSVTEPNPVAQTANAMEPMTSEAAGTPPKPVETRDAATANSPFRPRDTNLDADEDGVMDHRPDDPGIDKDAKPAKKKGLFF